MSKIIIFYRYTEIPRPKELQKKLLVVGTKLGITGRILLAQEGINGTMGGTDTDIEQFKSVLLQYPFFQHIDFKESPGSSAHFPKLQILIKDEIVRLGIDPKLLPATNAGNHLTPAEVHQLLAQQDPQVMMFDARNFFESKIGRFENAHRAQIQHFRELPQYIDQQLEKFKDKTVIMYCTAGIRCERGSAYLKSKNIAKKVYQLQGGIHRYCEQYPDGYFRGKNYVFDGRIAVKINEDVIATCDLCNVSCDDFTNCINAQCNKQFVSCSNCTTQFNNTCSSQCKLLVEQKKVVIRTKPVKIDI